MGDTILINEDDSVKNVPFSWNSLFFFLSLTLIDVHSVSNFTNTFLSGSPIYYCLHWPVVFQAYVGKWLFFFKKISFTECDSHTQLVTYLHKIMKGVWIRGGENSIYILCHLLPQIFWCMSNGNMFCHPILETNCCRKTLLLVRECHIPGIHQGQEQ